MLRAAVTLTSLIALALETCAHRHYSLNVVLTNDDGWAEANIRAQKSALDAAGPIKFNTVLSAPAENESGTGSSDAPATPLVIPCEFNTCPIGSPAEGFNASDPSLNFVNSFPVTSVRFGIQTLAPKFFGGQKPDIVVSGPNVGSNLGSTVQISGTVGAATEASIEGIPSIAFSGATGSQVSFTTLEAGDSAETYAAVAVTLVEALVASGKPFLLPNTSLNVNFPSATGPCTAPSAYTFVLTRILANPNVTDVFTCGTDHLPTESSIIDSTTTCQSTVSVFNVTGKADVDAATQEFVLNKLQNILTCP
ncbi:sure-like protein [Ramaria rubella]|nr:sure-like protein [Ramaria rubella]